MAKRRFTWLDGVICGILVLAIAAAAVWFFFLRDDGAEIATKEYDLTLRFTQATTDPYDFYRVGDTMYFQGRTGVLGTITALQSMDRITEELDKETGTFREVVDPRFNTIEMTVRVQGTLTETAFEVNGDRLYIGREFYPQSNTTRSAITIWDIEEVAE